ncbi:BTAD domain-containing putative transcriptional regulator [Actinoplanes sp. NPDC051470]|uniref:AfsR/SARP family transcriptional regulator n=1 Tax=Actinoplanes sp. NPDC051470 TaxID=3157224 RepID=UPI00341A9A13
MRFLILGPLEVRDGERLVALGGPQQRALLALLLARPGRVVSIDQITEQLWGASAPSAARSLAQECVAGLRRALTTGRDGVLLTRAPGYVLSLAPGALDLDRFDELVKDATQLAETGARERAAAMLREALALWRGPAFDGIDLDPCRSEAARLEEHRLAVVEQRVANELRLGRHAELIAELQALTADHPLRERFWAQLITALHRSDRQADALEAYRTVRATLVGELGVEPGPALRQAHQDVLSGAPAAVPAQLPTSASAFTGREHDLLRLDEVLGDSGGAPSIAVICGTAGVGKTALAVRWSHRVRDHFDGGQLYADLRGYAAAPRLRPIEVLTGFLRALDVPVERIPADQEQASALYRTILADRRILVVLDNASSADQVRPLLPGGRPGLVLVTSRDKLGGLVAREGAAHLTLDVLSPAEARALLETVLGADRVAGEPAAVAELAARCAYLPLALRIAAANLTLYPRRTVADQVAEMDALSPLGALAVESDEQHAVRASYNLSYSGLATPARRLFRLLGIAPSADHTADDATAVLGDTSPREAAGLLRHLTDAHLLDEHARGRYVSHDLLRLYAMERADDEDPPDRRRAAIGRLYDGYLRRARAAADMLYPHMLRLPNATTVPATGRHTYPDETAALAWLEAERHNLAIAIRYAAAHGPRRAGWQLADTLRGYFHLRRYASDWFTAADAALLAARHENDAAAEAAARHSLGTAYRPGRGEPAPDGPPSRRVRRDGDPSGLPAVHRAQNTVASMSHAVSGVGADWAPKEARFAGRPPATVGRICWRCVPARTVVPARPVSAIPDGQAITAVWLGTPPAARKVCRTISKSSGWLGRAHTEYPVSVYWPAKPSASSFASAALEAAAPPLLPGTVPRSTCPAPFSIFPPVPTTSLPGEHRVNAWETGAEVGGMVRGWISSSVLAGTTPQNANT